MPSYSVKVQTFDVFNSQLSQVDESTYAYSDLVQPGSPSGLKVVFDRPVSSNYPVKATISFTVNHAVKA